VNAFLAKKAVWGNRRGIALLIILASLAILTIVVVAFLAGGLSEVKSAKVYSSGANVKLLSQTAVNLVLAEINDATSGKDPSGNLVTWASQPGMIRTFRPQDTSPNCDYYYKLYSSSTMIGSGTVNATTDFGNMQKWYNNPAYYTDLNSPVAVSGANHYPILPGDISGNSPTVYSPTVKAMTDYNGSQIFNRTYQTVTGTMDIAGFWEITPGKTNGLPTAAVASNAIPMPVQWLYILQDGTVVAPSGTATSNTSSAKTTVTIAGATAINPIVGRIAFWTDDESCKVNINTASEGVYVDTPRVATTPEVNLANNQPANHEFQRYPGHPAMTSLSTVLGSWMSLPPGGTTASAYAGLNSLLTSSGTANYTTYMKPYYDLTPKYSPGIGLGSMGGSTKATGTMTTKTDRLYDSVDELMFTTTLTGTQSRAQNVTATATVMTQTQLEETKFFLTAHSRSPDVNLFNQPRVGIWPIPTSNPTTLDQLIAFTTTLSGTSYPYFFQRTDNTSPTTDISIARNQGLLNYLKNFCTQNVPGFGNSATFATKYSPSGYTPGTTKDDDLDQIFTEMFDYVRCTNLHDVTGTPYTSNNLVVPSYDAATDTKGFGRMLTVAQAALVFIAVDDGDWNFQVATDITGATAMDKNGQPILLHAPYFYDGTASGTPALQTPYYHSWSSPPNLGSGANTYSSYTNYAALGKKRVQAALMMTLFDPALGFPEMLPGTQCTFTVTGLQNLTLGSQSLGFNSSYKEWPSYTWGTFQRQYGGNWGSICLNSATGGANGIPTSGLVELSTAGGSMSFSGGVVTVTVAYGGKTVQTINFNFPANNTLPLPTMVNSDLALTGTTTMSGSITTQTVKEIDSSKTLWCIPKRVLNPTTGAPPTTIGTATPSGTTTATIRPWIVPANHYSGGNPPFWYAIDFASLSSSTITSSGTSIRTGRLADDQNTNQASTVSPYGPNWAFFATPNPYDVVRAVQSTSGDYRLSAAKYNITGTDSVFTPHPRYATSETMAHGLVESNGNPHFGATRGSLAHLSVTGFYSLPSNSSGYFSSVGGGSVGAWTGASPSIPSYQSPPGQYPFPLATYPTVAGLPTSSASWIDGGTVLTTANVGYTLEGEARSVDGVVAGYNPSGVTTSSGPTSFTDFADNGGLGKAIPGDWDNGMGNVKDGAYINKPDEGINYGTSYTQSPYFAFGGTGANVTLTTFSPNRQIPSPVMFGSLPTGVFANAPWQTLLFHPNPLGSGSTYQHKGAQSPPDHLLLDLFTMPVVEPYAISEPLSTAGRINMNYQILPFTYINRDTGIRAVLKSERMLAIPNSAVGGGIAGSPGTGISYKGTSTKTTNGTTGDTAYPPYPTTDFRFDINPDETLKSFQARFGGNDVFRSPSEICALDLIPQDATDAHAAPGYSSDGSKMASYWQDHALTGDNSRERPYADIYPRLTTKSNTFTIHMRVQTLQQTKTELATSPTTWTEGTDLITGEYRGSETVERYVDPNDSRLIDYVAAPSVTPSVSLGSLYKFRVVSTKQFAP